MKYSVTFLLTLRYSLRSLSSLEHHAGNSTLSPDQNHEMALASFGEEPGCLCQKLSSDFQRQVSGVRQGLSAGLQGPCQDEAEPEPSQGRGQDRSQEPP